ncbi:hypothetical protein MLD38_021777 [Melastoma candidum]|uniref:Uncharacterized protein n=1 Tax=Melastoma candidum TaxID=119954 RepID=A0ACB9QL11_9MYRT|nr:hypothetical protein MLD38_021777 [Melastoma candidum]
MDTNLFPLSDLFPFTLAVPRSHHLLASKLMAEFRRGLHGGGGGGGGLRPSPFSFLDVDPTMDLLRFANSTAVFHPIPNDKNGTGFFLSHQEVPLHLQPQEDMSGGVVLGGAMNQSGYVGSDIHDGNYGDDDCKIDRKKRRKKPLELLHGSCSASANSSVPVKRRKQQGSGGGVRGKKIIKGDDDDEGGGDGRRKEVVHVRARRGQATDSHSLAERVRRGKINERLKCLQDIVPGCYKTMGLAVMLDEIINYVQSLQHQVEFLSMKLTAASSFYDFNSESDLIDAMRKAMAYEAKEMEKLLMKRQLECHSVTTTATMFHPFDPAS